MLKNLIKLVKDEDGITAMEYGLLAAAIAGVLILVAFFRSLVTPLVILVTMPRRLA